MLIRSTPRRRAHSRRFSPSRHFPRRPTGSKSMKGFNLLLRAIEQVVLHHLPRGDDHKSFFPRPVDKSVRRSVRTRGLLVRPVEIVRHHLGVLAVGLGFVVPRIDQSRPRVVLDIAPGDLVRLLVAILRAQGTVFCVRVFAALDPSLAQEKRSPGASLSWPEYSSHKPRNG